MVTTLLSVSRALTRFNDKLGTTVSWLTFAMVLVTFLIVVLRYGFNIGWIAMQETLLYLHAMVFMLGAAYTLGVDEHVRVDIFYQRFSPRQRAWVNLGGTLFFLLPVCGFIFASSWDYMVAAWELRERSQEAGGLPWVWLLKTLIGVFSISLILQGISMVLRDIVRLSPSGGQL